MKPAPTLAARACLLLMLTASAVAWAQQLETKFSCSTTRDEDGERVIYADNGEIRIEGNRIVAFRWESALYRPTHGFDCSIDEDDGLRLEAGKDAASAKWRISLANGQQARERRGFNFSRGLNCSIRLEREGDTLNIKPSCPALCGSRANFSELSVDMKTGKCRHEE
ncbi:hypothetical protein D3870_01315 [Noviherbaspirillum cavernae]|uniref:DUF3757 domain-containing protein n=1 Tax=Noviherbaspirillum cavernae TaxID=2320862 RepID=A0A418WXB7_9BURK|nr:hypothetical protein [Noviherbaspirillum cavernae]RJG04841.1 hypothetical protein D3870_01315 [Noviherbaspirillum cavernae]